MADHGRDALKENTHMSAPPIAAINVMPQEPDPSALPWWRRPPYHNGGQPHAMIVTLTPPMAEELLAHNLNNRNLNKTRGKVLSGAITRGEWQLANDAIVINTQDIVDNGQHRAWAVIDSGNSIQVLVLFNADPQAKAFMDLGAKRSIGDVLHMAGEKHAATLGAVVTAIYWWEQDGVPVSQNRQSTPTVPQLLDVLDRRPAVRESITGVGEQPLMTRSFAATHHFIFALIDPEEAQVFMDLLRTGEGLKHGDPILTLRERFLREKAKASGGLHTTVRSAFMHRAWKAWEAGLPLRQLTFRMGGHRPDNFPVVKPDDEE
jgi:hypothetical protein